MGKPLSELGGLDAPTPGASNLDHERQLARDLLAEVLEMLEGRRYDFAYGFLKDLSLTLEQTERCSQAQRDAVDNVRRGGDRQRDRGEQMERRGYTGGRRYEGFGGRWR